MFETNCANMTSVHGKTIEPKRDNPYNDRRSQTNCLQCKIKNLQSRELGFDLIPR
jgi:hypothetical protein